MLQIVQAAGRLAAGLLFVLPASALMADDGTVLPPGQPNWATQAAREAHRVPALNSSAPEQPPAVIPGFQQFRDPDGLAANYLPEGPVSTDNQPFFISLGSNGRTCQTCHQPASAWTITPPHIQRLFQRSGGTAPLFRPIDGAVCPNADTSTNEARLKAYNLLLDRGVIRVSIELPAPPTLQFSIIDVQDPNGCNTSAEFGLSSFGPSAPTQGHVSVYRRPLPAANLPFLTTIMWDGREASLQSQAMNATLIHAQAAAPPTQAQIDQIVAFETGVYAAQSTGSQVGALTAYGGQGGPQALANQAFSVGVNDPLGTPGAFNPDAMTVYAAWESRALLTSDPDTDSIARGEKLFNEKPIAITGVAGLNDKPGFETVNGTCSTCHNTPNVGDHSVGLPLNIGVVASSAPGLDVTGLPVFTIRCDAGPLAGEVVAVTDPGKALLSGQCADIGKTKGPILRNLAARAPYFHNGAAADLTHVVEFYDTRFGIGFTDQEKADLVAFLKAL